MRLTTITAVTSFLFVAGALHGQVSPPAGMVHTPGMQHTPGMEAPAAPAKATQGGQAAFAAISEIVQLLKTDSTTNWSAVNIEALRQHLIDMDAVTLRARVQQTETPGGLSMSITGDAAVAGSIRRMVTAHAPMLQALGGWTAKVAEIPNGIRLSVVASNVADSALTRRIRGLGFIGLMTEGAHHTEHHLAIARGAGVHAHGSN